jgi:hypothetical protein
MTIVISPNTVKLCKGCQTELPLTAFVKDHRNKDGRGARCKPCYNASKTYSPERQRRYKLKHLYGLTPEQYNEILEEQNGCKICHKKSDRYHVDHDHSTGKVRGILCLSCNVAIGHFSDNLSTLQNAIAYLSKHA